MLWARDAYGSRFAIAAQVATDRWYLWDVDTCGFKTFTVHSGVYPTAEAALAEWRAGVGDLAAGSAVLTPADDAELVERCRPYTSGAPHPGLALTRGEPDYFARTLE